MSSSGAATSIWTTSNVTSAPDQWQLSRPIVVTSPMDGSPQSGLLQRTTLWHSDAAEWAPSTASKADFRRRMLKVRYFVSGHSR
jgi:hypothetical protein